MESRSAGEVSTEALSGLADYDVIQELGRGGMGVVYLATNKLMGRKEVLKVVNQQALGDAKAMDRFLQEIRSAAQLSHANIVTAYSVLRPGESLVLAMEYVDGEDLFKVVSARGPLPVANACYYIHQALGLQHAFEKGMVHRDIKPDNLILARDGKKHVVKILDFGLAKATRGKADKQHNLTVVGQMMGTPDYISPEQILDAAKADIRADIYSLGCTLYFLLTGSAPFKGQNLSDILEGHLSRKPTSLHELRSEVPVDLAMMVDKMMAKDAKDRYQKPVEVAQALAPFVKGVKPLPAGDAKADPSGKTATISGAGGKSTSKGSTGVTPGKPKPVLKMTMIEADATDILKPRPKVKPPESEPAAWNGGKILLIGGGIGTGILMLLMMCLISLWAAGLFRVKTPEGVLVVQVEEPNPDVYVDGEKVTVKWAKGGKEAEIRIKPGTRKVEVKKDGFTIFGEQVELQDGRRRILRARLVSLAAATPDKKGNEPLPLPQPTMEPPKIDPLRMPQPKPEPPMPQPKPEPPMPVHARENKFETIKLFNGRNLDGWEGYTDLWSVKNGVIIARSEKPLKFSTYLFTKDKYSDFRLVFSVKLAESEMHSGVAFWGKRFLPNEAKDAANENAEHTYQGHLVMFPSGWGLFDLYRRAGGINPPAGIRNVAIRAGKQHDWNDLEIMAQGNRIRLVVNGKLALDWRDPNPTLVNKGPIALQLHSNTVPQEVQFKGLELTTFPDDKLLTVKELP